jgi:acyl-CoA hydrolase
MRKNATKGEINHMTQNTKLTLTLAQIMLPHQTNLGGNVHGGEIFKLMDMAAGSACIQYAKTKMVTARVDELQFTAPVHVGDYVTCTTRIIYTGNTSLDVLITVDAEDCKAGDGPRRVASAFFTHVSIGADDRPQRVEPLAIENAEQQQLYDSAKKRRATLRRAGI